MNEDFGESDTDSRDSQDQTTKAKGKELPIEKLSTIYQFLLSVTDGLSHEQVKNVHQNPLQFVRTDKETELLDLVAKDERFRGMMELYGMFRNLIA